VFLTKKITNLLYNFANSILEGETYYVHLALYASLDGKHWQRVGDTGPWADNGRTGSYDYGFLNDSVAGQLARPGYAATI